MPARPRYLVLTPGMTGADGIAELSRLVVRALGPDGPADGAARVDVVSVTDPPGFGSSLREHPGVRFAGAGGRRLRFVAAALRAGLGDRPAASIICLHLHLGPVARLIAGRRAPVTALLLGIEAWRPLGRAQRLALGRADRLVSISAHTAQRFRAANPAFDHRPIQVCHLAVRDRQWAAPAPPAEGPLPGRFALIVGRMAAAERYKGHDLLIDVWPDVVAGAGEVGLVVVGDGDDRGRLEARARARAVPASFLGRVPDAALAALYRDCAFFVMPSRDEGFGLVFLEAMRAGKACIGGVGAAAELIEDGVTGLVVEPAAGPVRAAVLRLLREPATARRMGEAGAARVRGAFTEAHFRGRFRALLGIPPSAA